MTETPNIGAVGNQPTLANTSTTADEARSLLNEALKSLSGNIKTSETPEAKPVVTPEQKPEISSSKFNSLV